MPYEPEPSCVIDVSNFSDYADVSAYEVVRLLSKDMLEFNSLQDHDVLDALTKQLYQHDGKKIFINFVIFVYMLIQF